MSIEMSKEFYQPADGMFFVSQKSPYFVEIYNQRCEEIRIDNMIFTLKIRLLKVDDTFVKTHLDKNNILAELNRINEKSMIEEEVYNRGRS